MDDELMGQLVIIEYNGFIGVVDNVIGTSRTKRYRVSNGELSTWAAPEYLIQTSNEPLDIAESD